MTRRNLLRLITPILAILTLAACMPSHGKRYYQFYLEPDGQALRLDKTVLVEPAAVDPVYEDYRVVYRLSPHELNYYSYEFWIRLPGLMIREAIYDYFIRCGVFNRVITQYSEADPHWLLKTHVQAMEEVDGPDAWKARLKMTLTLRDFKTGDVLAEHAFDRLETLTEKKVSRLPVVLSRILQQELSALLRKLAPRNEKISGTDDSEPKEIH